MTSPRLLAPLLLVASLFAGACSVQGQGRAQVRDDDAVPFGLLDQDVPPLLPPVTAAVTETVSLCFVDVDGAVVAVDAALDPPIDLPDVVEALAEPPGSAAGSLRTAVGEPPLVRDVRLVAGVARVDLLPAITELGGDEQLLAVAQLVCTLTGRPGVGLVSFTLVGSPVDVPRGDGSLTSGPVSRDDYANLVA
ncbi:MAG: GerMN domain-containing protein [Acidimicrobiales bacterium]